MVCLQSYLKQERKKDFIYGIAVVTAARRWMCANPIFKTGGLEAADVRETRKKIYIMKKAPVLKCCGKTLCTKATPAV